MYKKKRKPVALAVLLLVSCAFVYFGYDRKSNNVQVTGKVSFEDGNPLPEGRIIFQDEQFEYFSDLNPDGTFCLWTVREGDGIPPGNYRVYLRFGNVPDEDLPVMPVFTSPRDSELTARVENGKRNRFEFVVRRQQMLLSSEQKAIY